MAKIYIPRAFGGTIILTPVSTNSTITFSRAKGLIAFARAKGTVTFQRSGATKGT